MAPSQLSIRQTHLQQPNGPSTSVQESFVKTRLPLPPPHLAADLKSLSNFALHQAVQRLGQHERRISCLLIRHLQEVHRRRLWAEMAFPSLFDYCVKALGYSEADAYRKMSAVQLLQEIPEIQSELESGEINLTTIAKAYAYFKKVLKYRKVRLSKDQKLAVVRKLIGKTQKEIDREIAALLPEAPAKFDRYRFVSEGKVEVFYTADLTLIEKFDRLRGLLAHSLSQSCDQNELLHKMCDIALAKVDPLARVRMPAKSIS